MHRSAAPVPAAPYVVALVRLSEGPVVLTNVVGCDPADVRCDLPVTLTWEPVERRAATCRCSGRLTYPARLPNVRRPHALRPLSLLQHPVERDVREVMAERIELVHLIRDLGFDSVVCGQHFLVPPDVFMLQPVPVLGRIIAEAGELQVGTSILLATLVNPVELVENVLTLAAMTEQPFMVGVGAGYRPEEDAAFGVPEGSASGTTPRSSP